MSKNTGLIRSRLSGKRQVLLIGLFYSVAWITGCGGGGSGVASSQTPTNSNVSGSWQLTVNAHANSPVFPSPTPPVPFALYLSQNGEQVTGWLLQETNGCMGTVQLLTGTFRAAQLTLSTQTSSVSLSARIAQNGTLSGTFQFNGQTPYCASNDSGTFTGVSVAPLAGQWSGTGTSAVSGHSFQITFSLNEDSLARSGFPALTGQAIVSGGAMGCVTGTATFAGEQQGARISGTGSGSSGPLPALTNTVIVGTATISNIYFGTNVEVTAELGTLLNPPPTANSMTLFYTDEFGGPCYAPGTQRDSGTIVINRQQ
jgi:hypothetical protein